jgi:hypothetical protein
VRGKSVEHAAHVHDCASEFEFLAEDLCAIGRREYGFADIKTDFAPIDIERGNDFNVIRPIRADLAMHQPGARPVGRGAVIKIYSLDKRAGTITNSNDGNSYFSHAIIKFGRFDYSPSTPFHSGSDWYERPNVSEVARTCKD